MSDDQDDRFNVVVFDADGYWFYRGKDMTGEDAVTLGRAIVDEAEEDELIHRVMITDEDDLTCLLWERGKGLVFPQPKDLHPQ